MSGRNFLFYDQETFSLKETKSVGSSRVYRERYGQRLYEADDRMAIDQTASAQNNLEVRLPLVYRLECRKRWIHYLTRPLARVAAMNLAIFDTSGEDLDNPDSMDLFCRYLLRASGIIFLIDPFQYPGIRGQLSSDLRKRLPKIDGDPSELVASVINMFESRAGLSAGEKIKIPVAFAFTKCDMLKSLVDTSSSMVRDCSHKNGFNVENCQEVSEEVMACIKQWNSPLLVDLAKKHFKTWSFFATSALGELPDDQLRIRSVSPTRVGDPLLWMLWQRGYIPAKRG